jgi:nitrite reductase/ring-hydroxylating ferredoxin subunit
VHAAANSTAITLYLGSLLARSRQRTGLGKALGYAGLAAVAVGGLLGGDISYRQAGGANHAEEIPHLVEPGWHDLTPLGLLNERQPVHLLLGEVPLLAVRDGGRVYVLADKCSHMSGPLSEGPLSEGEVSNGCVTCPWHGSVFRLADGSVARGPATADQPAFQTRVQDGIVQVCLPGAG